MNNNDILALIQKDPEMMRIIKIAEAQHLKDWLIGAGFIRNKVWDTLHGKTSQKGYQSDIDLVYFDPFGYNEVQDRALGKQLTDQTTVEWEVVNQFYAHKYNNIEPYSSTENAISKWPETATGIGITIKNDELILVAPHGITDLVEMIIRPSPYMPGAVERVKERMKKKNWLERWPKLKIIGLDVT